MKMFTAKEEKNLSYVLSKTGHEESMMFLEELHGLLFRSGYDAGANHAQ